MELVFAIAAGLLVFGFVGYQFYKSRSSSPTRVGGRQQSVNPSREVEREVEEKLDRKDRAIREYNESKSSSQPKRKSSSSRSAKPRKSTPRKAAPKKSTAKKSTGRSKNVKSKG